MTKSKADIKDDSFKSKLGNRDGIYAKDRHLFNAIRNCGLTISHVAEKANEEEPIETREEFGKKHVVRLSLRLYNNQTISDEDLFKLRTAVSKIMLNLKKEVEASERMSDRKRKIRLILESGDEKKMEQMLKNIEKDS